jgi:hypothetical protein
MTTRRFLCRIGSHQWTPQRSEDGEPLALAGQSYEVCRRCGAVRERPWAGGPVGGSGGIDGAGGDG